MKGLKDLKILNTQYFVDGKQVTGDAPNKGKVVFCKIKCQYTNSIGDTWHHPIFEGKGKAELHEDDAFDYNKGKDIAFARAIKDVLVQADSHELALNYKIVNRRDLIYDLYIKYDNKLIDLGAKRPMMEIDDRPVVG